MIKQKILFVVFFTINLTILTAQESVNKYDNKGERHGYWTKDYHNTNQKRYEGKFNHGKEIDTFKFYTLSRGKSVLSAIKVFNAADSIADVTFFSSKKKIISKGKMNGKRFIGKWLYYHKSSESIMTEELYNDKGLLEGIRTVFYENGKVAEEAYFTNGKLNGEAKWYSKRNELLRVSNYKNDQLDGKTTNYNGVGDVVSEGLYAEDQKMGIWKYYTAGKLTKEIDHTKKKVISKKQ